MIAGSLLGLDAFVKFLMRCDLLRPEVARLVIGGAAGSTLSAETSSLLRAVPSIGRHSNLNDTRNTVYCYH